MTVDKDKCDTRHKGLNRQLGIVYGFLGLFLVLVGWALVAGNTSRTDSGDIERALAVHEAAQIGDFKRFEMMLLNIEKMAREHREEMKTQRQMIETILRWRVARDPVEEPS